MEADVASAAGQPDKPRARRRWYQFSLRTLLLFVLLASIGLSWLAVKMREARKQREAVAAIMKMGGRVLYDYECDASEAIIPNAKPPGPAWLRKLVGDDFFANVALVVNSNAPFTDANMEQLRGWTRLRWLNLSGTKVTDGGLMHLKGLTQLRGLHLDHTQVTDAGLEHLKGLTKLIELNLGSTNVTDAGLVHLKGLTQLRLLFLSSTKVTDAGLEHLKGLTQLKALLLMGTQTTDAGLERRQGVAYFHTTTELLQYRTKVTDAGVKELQKVLPKIKAER